MNRRAFPVFPLDRSPRFGSMSKMDALARQFAQTHDPEVRKEIEELTRILIALVESADCE
jgi:hypothetical protein